MEKSQQETDAWRILLFGRRGAELLLVRSLSGIRLPEFRIPRWQRIVPNLNTEAKRLWNLDTVCLFPFDVPHSEPTAVHCKYHVMEVSKPEELARIAPDFVLLSSLKEASFADKRDYLAVQQGMGFGGASFPKECQGPFSAFGAFGEIAAWVEKQLLPLGLVWDGNFRQLQAGASFALIRFQTNRGGVWFKAVGEPNRREFPITMELTARYPEHVPGVLAKCQEWNGWLTEEVEGEDLFSSSDPVAWARAAESLANLQIESIRDTSQILDSGAHDVRPERLLAVTDPFFSAMECIMETQTKASPRKLTRQEIQSVQRQVTEALHTIEDAGVPHSLNHVDLNPGNILLSPSKCTFLDWTEAAVGNPFLSMEYLRQHFLRAFPESQEVEIHFRKAYLRRWKSHFSEEAADQILSLLPLTAVFAYAVSVLPWDQRQVVQRPGLAAFLRSLVRRMHRESELMTNRAA
jgi:thiamine kinase-like enzyme